LLLLESTALGAGSGCHGLLGEQEVEEELVAPASGEPDKLLALIASGQNLVWPASCFGAEKRMGRWLVMGLYHAFVELKLAPLSRSIPLFAKEGVRMRFGVTRATRSCWSGTGAGTVSSPTTTTPQVRLCPSGRCSRSSRSGTSRGSSSSSPLMHW